VANPRDETGNESRATSVWMTARPAIPRRHRHEPQIAVLARASGHPNLTGDRSGQAKTHDLPSTATWSIHQIQRVDVASDGHAHGCGR